MSLQCTAKDNIIGDVFKCAQNKIFICSES